MTSNIKLIEQLDAWEDRKITATVINSKCRFSESHETLSRHYVDTVEGKFEGQLGHVKLNDDELDVEIQLPGGVNLMHLVLFARSEDGGFMFSRDFNKAAHEVFRLTGVKVATGIRIFTADDCHAEGCSRGRNCPWVDRTELLIELR